MKPGKPGQTQSTAASRRTARPGAEASPPASSPSAPTAPGRLRPEEWRGKKRNTSINEAITAKFKVLHARGKSLAQIADKLGISVGRARNIFAEIRLGKK